MHKLLAATYTKGTNYSHQLTATIIHVIFLSSRNRLLSCQNSICFTLGSDHQLTPHNSCPANTASDILWMSANILKALASVLKAAVENNSKGYLRCVKGINTPEIQKSPNNCDLQGICWFKACPSPIHLIEPNWL